MKWTDSYGKTYHIPDELFADCKIPEPDHNRTAKGTGLSLPSSGHRLRCPTCYNNWSFLVGYNDFRYCQACRLPVSECICLERVAITKRRQHIIAEFVEKERQKAAEQQEQKRIQMRQRMAALKKAENAAKLEPLKITVEPTPVTFDVAYTTSTSDASTKSKPLFSDVITYIEHSSA